MSGKDKLAAALAARGRAPKSPRAPSKPGRASGRPGGRAKAATTPELSHAFQASSSEAMSPIAQSALEALNGEPKGSMSATRVVPTPPPGVFVHGENRAVLRGLPESWADCIITDPGVGSLADVDGWRNQVPGPEYWSACFRAAKPGAHMAIFAGRKTLHRVATYAEDAGWEMRDTVVWLYPKGMPMALDIGQAVDRKMGGDGEAYFRTIGSLTDTEREAWLASRPGNPWYGWGTELRPSWEPILLMRRPINAGSVAENCLRYGVGALNIDAIRIDSGERDAIATHIPEGQGSAHGLALQKDQAVVGTTTLGRWPADVLFSHDYDCGADGCTPDCPVGALDAQDPDRRELPSRFFYAPKASRREKDVGLGHKANTHKAVKPVAITDWLTKMLCPRKGVVLDPFGGVGSTGLSVARLAVPAAFVAIEADGTWVDMAAQRYSSALDLD